MLARLLQWFWGSIGLAVLGGAAVCWSGSLGVFVVAVLGLLMLLLAGFAVTLAIPFLGLHLWGALRSGQRPATTSSPESPLLPTFPTGRQALRAWWGEGVAGLKAFGWWMPFRAQAQADFLPETPTGRRGVVLVHGFVCNRGLWTPWFAPLRARGHAYVAVSLEPVFGSIDAYAAVVEEAVQRVQRATGLPPVLVCHSMGGLAARAWLRSVQRMVERTGEARKATVARVITLGTPHHGTALAAGNPFTFGQNALQMQRHSPWLKQLAQDEAGAGYAGFTCFYGHCDNVVFPLNTATLPGADNRHVAATGHVAMAMDHEVMAACLAELVP